MYDSEGEDDDDLLFPTNNATTTSHSTTPASMARTVGTSRPVPSSMTPSERDAKRRRSTTGYSSDDDDGARAPTADAHATLPEDENAFEQDLQRVGFELKRMIGDGNCLFRAVAHQVYGDADMHDEVRRRCMDYMEKERDHYSQFVAEEDFVEYIRRKRQDKVFGNHLEIQAISEIYNRPIEVYAYGQREPINIFHRHYSTEYAPIRLSYHYGNHYNAVIDPENPSVGVGLGLPQLSNPGLEMERAIEQSIEETLYKDVVAASEWEATQRQLEEEVLRQSALEANVAVPSLTPDSDAAPVLGAPPVDGEGDFCMTDEDERSMIEAALRASRTEAAAPGSTTTTTKKKMMAQRTEASVGSALPAAREIVEAATYATFITLDSTNAPSARLVFPSPPETNFGIIRISTHPASRKVAQLKENPTSALTYAAKDLQAYVTFLGPTTVILDPEQLRKYWRDDLLVYYAGGWAGGNYAVLEMKPQRIEIVSYRHGIAIDPNRWQPLVLNRDPASEHGWQIDPRSLRAKQNVPARL